MRSTRAMFQDCNPIAMPTTESSKRPSFSHILPYKEKD